MRGASGLHGAGGPLKVADLQAPHPVAAAFLEAAQACGHAFNSDVNGPQIDGFGYVQATQSKGWRCSSAHAFIDPVRSRPNLAVSARSTARRIRIERGPRDRARGRYRRPSMHLVGRRRDRRQLRRDRLAAAPDAVGHRRSGRAGSPWNRGPRRATPGRPQSSGSSRPRHDLCRPHPDLQQRDDALAAGSPRCQLAAARPRSRSDARRPSGRLPEVGRIRRYPRYPGSHDASRLPHRRRRRSHPQGGLVHLDRQRVPAAQPRQHRPEECRSGRAAGDPPPPVRRSRRPRPAGARHARGALDRPVGAAGRASSGTRSSRAWDDSDDAGDGRLPHRQCRHDLSPVRHLPHGRR